MSFWANAAEVMRAATEGPAAFAALGLAVILLSLRQIRNLPEQSRTRAFWGGLGVLVILIVALVAYGGVQAERKASAEKEQAAFEEARRSRAISAQSQLEARITAKVLQQLRAERAAAARAPEVMDFPADQLPALMELPNRRRDPNRTWTTTVKNFTFALPKPLQEQGWRFSKAGTSVNRTPTTNAVYAICNVDKLDVQDQLVAFHGLNTNKHGGVTTVCQFDLSAVLIRP